MSQSISTPTVRRTKRTNRLRTFVYDGLWASVSEGFAESNFNAFATFLSASAGQLGFLSSFQNLMGCWLQLWSEKLVHIFGSRKRLVLLCVFGQIFTLGVMLASILSGIGAFPFMILVFTFTALGGLSGPVWSTWVSELLPAKRKGLYFGIRNQRTYPANFISLLLAGFILQQIEEYLGGSHGVQIAFFVIFLIGLIAKASSAWHLFFQPEKAFELPKKPVGPIELIHRGFRNRRLRQIIYFYLAIGFAINLSAPFTTPYLLQTLHLNHFQFSLVTAAYVGARFFGAPTIGRIIDAIGCRYLLLVSAILLPFSPLGWSLSSNYISIMGVQFLGGLNWTIFDLCTFIYLAESSKPIDRQKTFAIKHISYGLGLAGGAVVGGLLIQLMGNIRTMFWISAVARACACILIFRMLGIKLRAQSFDTIPAEQDAVVESI